MRTPSIEFYQDHSDNHRWRLKHGNGKILAASSEGFLSKSNAKRNFKAVRDAMARALFIVAFIALAFGCTTSQQRTAYNTLASAETTATATVDGYYLACVKGFADTNGIPTVTKAYNKFQGVMQVAVLLAQNNTNALAPANVMTELSVVVSTVAVFTPTKSNPKTP